jgi:hypothetical protein
MKIFEVDYRVRDLDGRRILDSGTVCVEAESEETARRKAYGSVCNRSAAADLDDMVIEIESVHDANADAHEYLVAWRIEVTAASPREAAELALSIQRDDQSIAAYFDVTDMAG